MAGKQDLMDAAVNSGSGMTKTAANEAVDAILSTITEKLCDGEKVVLPGFGTFSVADRAAREGRNPATGETIQIAAKKVCKFKPGKALAEALNNN